MGPCSSNAIVWATPGINMTMLRAGVHCAAPAHVLGAQAARANVQGFCAADTRHLLQSVLHVSLIPIIAMTSWMNHALYSRLPDARASCETLRSNEHTCTV